MAPIIQCALALGVCAGVSASTMRAAQHTHSDTHATKPGNLRRGQEVPSPRDDQILSFNVLGDIDTENHLFSKYEFTPSIPGGSSGIGFSAALSQKGYDQFRQMCGLPGSNGVTQAPSSCVFGYLNSYGQNADFTPYYAGLPNFHSAESGQQFGHYIEFNSGTKKGLYYLAVWTGAEDITLDGVTFSMCVSPGNCQTTQPGHIALKGASATTTTTLGCNLGN